MNIRKAYKYRLKAKLKQKELFRQHAGCCRFVWNKALALQKQQLDAGEKIFRYVEMAKLLTGWKRVKETAFLADAPSQTLQQTLKFQDRALKEAFDKKNSKRFPRFKKKGREIEGIAKNVTVSRRGDHWYISIQTETEVAEPVHLTSSTVGIDLGVARFATLSDGSFLQPLNSFKKLEKQLAKEQRKLSRKVKFSSNWRKQKSKITQLHVRIADARNDYLHKASTTISKNHAMVVLEDLQIRNMSASAKGTTEEPGRNVRAKAGLSRAILDQGWFEFSRQLEYKEHWLGGQVVAVPPQYTSQTCPACDHIGAENRRSQARFFCQECGFEEHADLVAAMNILRAGHARIACEVSGAGMPPAAGTRQGGYKEAFSSA